MGRKKIEITKILDEKTLLVTFSKRKVGLINKAYELSILCDCKIAVLILTNKNRPHLYCNTDFKQLITDYDSNSNQVEVLTDDDVLKKRDKKKKAIKGNSLHFRDTNKTTLNSVCNPVDKVDGLTYEPDATYLPNSQLLLNADESYCGDSRENAINLECSKSSDSDLQTESDLGDSSPSIPRELHGFQQQLLPICDPTTTELYHGASDFPDKAHQLMSIPEGDVREDPCRSVTTVNCDNKRNADNLPFSLVSETDSVFPMSTGSDKIPGHDSLNCITITARHPVLNRRQIYRRNSTFPLQTPVIEVDGKHSKEWQPFVPRWNACKSDVSATDVVTMTEEKGIDEEAAKVGGAVADCAVNGSRKRSAPTPMGDVSLSKQTTTRFGGPRSP